MLFTREAIYNLFRHDEYDRRRCIVIKRVKEPFGGLLNMAPFPLVVNGITFWTLEHLYQCLRIPKLPRIQRRIIGTASPLLAKWISKPHRGKGRADWFELKFEMMWWCLHVKTAQHYEALGKLLDQTGDMLIVETSPDGDLWGAIPSQVKSKPHILVGSNVFGKMLMELRDEYRRKKKKELLVVEPIDIKDFHLLGKAIRRIIVK